MIPKLLCLLEHPTQYDPPLWAAMKRRGVLEPVVRYFSLGARSDPEAEAAVSWGTSGDAAAPATPGGVGAFIDGLGERPAACIVPGWTRPLTWKIAAACWRRGIPVILPSDRSLHEPVSLPLARTGFHALRSRLFQGFLTTGRLGWASLRSIGIPDSRIATGLYPVDCGWWREQVKLARARSDALRATLGGKYVVLAVTKWSPREDPLTVVRAFGKLARAAPDARLVLVGDGPLRDAVRAELAKEQVSDRAMLCGYVPYSTLPQYYGAADVFIHVPLSEPWGISVGEAMATGLPVVASTAVGAAADLVVPGRTGALVAPGDHEAAGAALVALADRRAREELRSRVAEAVQAVDVETASAAIEELVPRLRGAEPFEPMRMVIDSALRNHWGQRSS